MTRCFGDGDPLYERYHDEEWGRPVTDERGLFERMSLEAFQSGLAWITILRKREAFRAAFAGFEPEAVALPDQLVQRRAGVVQGDRRARVGDRRLDLRAVADDAGVGEQAGDVIVAEAGDGLGLEVRERGPERLALAQDRDPGEPGLERLERHALEQPAVVDDGAAPLLVVVALVVGLAVAEAAHGPSG